MTFKLPNHISPEHSIVTGEYAIYTPPIHEMINHLADWIDQQVPGGYIYGASRLGKSRCIRWHVAHELRVRFGAMVPLIVWNHAYDSYTSEAGFWHQLLLASEFEFVDPTKPPKKTKGLHQCIQRFIAIANNAQRNYVILLIDEAQDLTLREWKWLTTLQNKLEIEGYQLSVFSVGSHQLNYSYSYFGLTGNAHVAGRFMVAHVPFHGIRRQMELNYVLNGYDTDSKWPPDSGVSFLQYFAPRDYAAGRRLSESDERFWSALVKLTPKNARREFPMQHIGKAVEAALYRLAAGEDWDEVTSQKNWILQLGRLGFSDHMEMISTGL
ncbi:ATP-binding protein [Paraburkholderia youngii]|uniref:ATP-binding protein n=1 Tax=Paraburkholderia youngii TaxID=2782701 RepID=UPI003D208EFE